MTQRLPALVAFGIALSFISGCAKSFPVIVPTEGVVLLNGKPLPNASVTFMPMLDQFGAESYSSGVTDEKGKFTLTCHYNDQPGAALGKHIVLVTEAPLPDTMRTIQDSRVVDAYQAKLGNRPIPAMYASAGKSPIRIDVAPGQKSVTVELTR